jgi:hypothetical protein
MEINWISEDDLKAAVPEFQAKYDSGDLDGVADAALFFKALGGAILMSKESDDDKKKEFYENISTDIEEYTSLAYFIEIRDSDTKLVMKLKGDESAIGTYTDEYEPFADVKNNIWMDWTPATQLQMMKGNPNTDAQFFSGDLTVKGSIKLASKPRSWITDFFDFIDRPVD